MKPAESLQTADVSMAEAHSAAASSSASESASASLKLDDVVFMLQEKGEDEGVQKLLQDIPVLQQWQKAEKPPNALGDAMTKLSPRWDVLQYSHGSLLVISRLKIFNLLLELSVRPRSSYI